MTMSALVVFALFILGLVVLAAIATIAQNTGRNEFIRRFIHSHAGNQEAILKFEGTPLCIIRELMVDAQTEGLMKLADGVYLARTKKKLV